MCYSSWGCKESDRTEQLNSTEDRDADRENSLWTQWGKERRDELKKAH